MTEQVELLTARERECLRLVDRHFSSKQIARELGMSKTSVDTYCDRARRKLGVNDRYHAARLLADHEREGAGADPVLIASGQDAVRTDPGAAAWSGEASSGGETHEALERRGSTGVGEPRPAPQTRDRGLRGKVAETLAAGGVDAGLRVGPAGAATDRSGGLVGPGRHGDPSGVSHSQAGGLQAPGNGDAGNPLPHLGVAGREFPSWRSGSTGGLGPAARIGLILAIAIGSALAFGGVLAGLQALTALV